MDNLEFIKADGYSFFDKNFSSISSIDEDKVKEGRNG